VGGRDGERRRRYVDSGVEVPDHEHFVVCFGYVKCMDEIRWALTRDCRDVTRGFVRGATTERHFVDGTVVAAKAASEGKDVFVYIRGFCEEVQTEVCRRSS
jgi:hypothetical protein